MSTQCEEIKKNFSDLYKIKKNVVIGYGQFGEVYSCEKLEEPEKKYCVKLIPFIPKKKDQKQQEEIISITLKEHTLNYKEYMNIVQVQDTFRIDESLYIVMEQCDEDLSKEFERMKQNNIWYTEEEVFDIIRQLITGFQQLYNLNIIHRDIKPENILIKKEKSDNVVQKKIYKIGDFGVGKLVDDARKQTTITGIGTLRYMAPQLLKKEQASGKCDIFSYGILFYQICYKGNVPYDVSTVAKFNQSLERLKQNPLKTPPLEYSRADVLKDLIEKMIVYEEKQRASFEEIFNHPVMKIKGIEETQIFQSHDYQQIKEQTNSLIFDEQSFYQKKKIQSISEDIQIHQRLLQICSYLNKHIDQNQKNYYLLLIIQLIAKQQLEYALAIIYIRPQDIHPIIKQDNDELKLFQILSSTQTTIQEHKQNYQEYLNYQQLIQTTYHKFFNNLQCFINKIELTVLNQAYKQDEEFVMICKQSRSIKIEISQLIECLKNIQKSKSTSIQKDLQELLDKIIDLENSYPIELFKSVTDIDENFPFQIQSYNY